MPDMPRYNSKGTLTTQQPSFMAPEDNTGRVIAEAGQQIGQTIAEVGVKWSNALDTIQKTTAKANYKTSLLDVMQRAEVDPNENNADKYFKEIEKLKTDSLKGFTNKQAQAETALELGYDSKVAQIQVQNMFRKKLIVVGQVKASDAIDAELSRPSANSLQEIENIITTNVQNGIFDAADGRKKLDEAKKTMAEYAIFNDTATDEASSAVLAELNKGEDGEYGYLSADDRLSMIKASKQRIFNNNQTFKRNTQDMANERGNAFIEKLASGKASLKDVRDEMAVPESDGGIKRSTLLKYQSALVSGIKNDLNMMLREKNDKGDPTSRAKLVKQYNDMIDNFVDDEIDAVFAKDLLAQSFADGIVNAQEQKFLNELKQGAKDIEFNRSTSLAVQAIKTVKNIFKMRPNATDETIARKIKALVGNMAGGEQPSEAVQSILKQDALENNPSIASYPKDGKIQYNPKLNKYRRVYPDGRVEEVSGA